MNFPMVERQEDRAQVAAWDSPASAKFGVVVIGRNEGARLARCLATVHSRKGSVVYVDSASRDESPRIAQGMGVEVLELSRDKPMSAARARNEGFARLIEIAPGVEFVQFVDGDCEIDPDWIDAALAAMDDRPEVAVVCGRLRELHPEASPYNRLADLEWDGPIGEVKACGGIFLVRAQTFRRLGGFDASVLAAEDDEFCLRVRGGGKILRLPVLMGWHDMAMTRFSAWWRRCVRTGQAYVQGFLLHGRGPERHFAGPLRGVVLWGLVVPAVALALAWPTHGLSLLLGFGYVALFFKVARYGRARGWAPSHARLYAGAVVLAKFPQAWGVLRFAGSRLFRRPPRLIEHKGAATEV